MCELEMLRKKIKDYANNDLEFGWHKTYYQGRNYKLPKRALLWYVFGKSNALFSRLPEYTAFSPTGIKCPMDNKYHTDVLLGADLRASYKVTLDLTSLESELLFQATDEIEAEYKNLINFDFTVLANTQDKTYLRFRLYDSEPLREGVWSSTHIDCAKNPEDSESHPLYRGILLPHAGIEFQNRISNADIIMVETGGPLCHLATVGREQKILMIKVANALSMFDFFSKFNLNLQEMSLKAIAR